MGTGVYFSELEKHFPRIASEFVKRWRTPVFEPYCYKLIVDERGSRKGFPTDVFDEILFLYWMDLNLHNFDPHAAFVVNEQPIYAR